MSDNKPRSDIRKPGRAIKLLVFAWFVVIFTALMYFTTERLVDFDPHATLLDKATKPSFYVELDAFFSEQFGSVSGRAFHVSDEACFCQTIADAHVMSVKELVVSETMENVSVSLSEYRGLQNFLPSVPAVIIYNTEAELIYVGPYSTGYLCSTGNGLVEALIPQMKQSASEPVVMSLARGCYCNI